MEAITPYEYLKNLKLELARQREILLFHKQLTLEKEEWEMAVMFRDIQKKLEQSIALFEPTVVRSGI